jgi:hypothetical protein
MLANARVGELWRPSRVSSIHIDGGSFWSYAMPAWLGLCCLVLPRFRAHRDRLPTSQLHHHNGKVHKGVHLHACGVTYRWQSGSGQSHTNYRFSGA